MIVQDVIDYVFRVAPNPEWGRENVYEFGNGTPELRGIGVAWWVTSAMLRDFAARGLNLALSHETLSYPVPDSYHWGTPCRYEDLTPNRVIPDLCREHGIVVHRFHSNLDLVAGWGMPAELIRTLGWGEQPVDWSRGVPVVEIPPTPFDEVVRHVQRKLGLPFVRCNGDPGRVIRRVAMAWGGLCQGWGGVATVKPLNPDVILGGDIIDGIVRLAQEEGWAVIDGLHHATEMPTMRLLAKKLRQAFPGVPVHYIENTMPWRAVV